MGVIFSLYSSYAVSGKDGINYRAEMLYALYAFSTDPVTGTDGSWGLDTGQSDMVTVSTGIDSFANSTSKNFISKSFSDNKPDNKPI